MILELSVLFCSAVLKVFSTFRYISSLESLRHHKTPSFLLNWNLIENERSALRLSINIPSCLDLLSVSADPTAAALAIRKFADE